MRKEVVRMYVDQGHGVNLCCEAASVNPSSYYYKENGVRRGRAPSKYTLIAGGGRVSNATVVEQIKALLNKEFVDYGYIKVTHWLCKRKGYLINRKKVYRLMKEHNLLNVKRKVPRRPRLWVTELVPQPDEIFEHLEIDIKYIYVQGSRRNVMQLTVLDIHSRYVLGYTQGYRIGQTDVIRLFQKIFAKLDFPESFYIRCDNGSQFIAHQVRAFFEQKSGAKQEFTRPATPEQNGHIEAFHSIIRRAICDRFCFEDDTDLALTMERFIEFYNTDRIHSGIDYECPLHVIRQQRPEFEPAWVIDYSGDKPLLGRKDQGLAPEEAMAGGNEHVILE